MKKIFVGFDSAWGASNSGAICDLVLLENGALSLAAAPEMVTWPQAFARVDTYKDTDLCVWAIDQPICVANLTGCRPVERNLSSALMKDFVCGAYSSNLRNPCWTQAAPIWTFLRNLAARGYRHEPMAIPNALDGKFYFECYPHPALLGLFALPRTLQYKVHHGNAAAWQELIESLLTLQTAPFPIANIDSFVKAALPQTKQNEDKLDAIICAYVSAYWWKFGTAKSTLIGDLEHGYMVTPHSDRIMKLLLEAFGQQQINVAGLACSPPATGEVGGATIPPIIQGTGANGPPIPPEPDGHWQGPASLCATDPANLWRTSQGAVINDWMEVGRLFKSRLWVRFIEEDGQPAVLFIPFANGDGGQGMKTVEGFGRNLWHFLVDGARRNNRLVFNVQYYYEPTP